MAAPEKAKPGGNRANAEQDTNVASLPTATKRGNPKTSRTRYVRLFPERIFFLLESLDDRELAAWVRLTVAYVMADGALSSDEKKLALVTKTGKRWPELRDKLVGLGLGRVEAGLWIDDDQQKSLDLQRQYSVRGERGAAARWGGRHG